MMPKMRRRLARKAAMEKVVVVASWLPPVIVSGCAYYAIGKWVLILVISVVSGLALDPLNRVWRELEDRRNR